MTFDDIFGKSALVVKLNVSNLATSTDWYCSKLGLVHDPRFDLPKFAQFNVPGLRRGAVGLFEVPEQVGTAGAVFMFVVHDIASVRQCLIDRGVDVSPLEAAGDGVQLAFFKDPDGNALALRQNPQTHPTIDQVGEFYDLSNEGAPNTFTLTYTALSVQDVSKIWDKIVDVGTWTTWDRRLEYIKAIGKLDTGASYTLKPWLGNEITIEVLEADYNKFYFHDKATVQLGTIETLRSIEKVVSGSLLTQTMRATIKDQFLHAFARSFWPDWAQGLIEATRALALSADIDSAALGGPDEVVAATQGYKELVDAHKN